MNNEVFRNYIKAGKIAGKAIKKARKEIKPGMKLLDIANDLEKFIKDKEGEFAFPINLSLNEKGAHYTPTRNDKTEVNKKDVLKVDIGVHVNGFVGDTATTICFNEKYNKMKEAVENALNAAIKLCKPGNKVRQLSEAIEKEIEKMDYKPVSNLTGHGLEQFNLHAEPQIPNVSKEGDYVLKEDDVIAIEPFATDGKGKIKESEETMIYSLLQPVRIKSPSAKKIVDFAKKFQRLPFAKRWIPIEKEAYIRLGLKGLERKNVLHKYPVLSEVESGTITQAEHTVIIKDEPIITTEVGKNDSNS